MVLKRVLSVLSAAELSELFERRNVACLEC